MKDVYDPVSIETAGAFTAPVLQTDQTGKVIGITSKGIFLLFKEHVLFLTSEHRKNPFMLYIRRREDFPQQVALNQEVKVEGGHLHVGERVYDLGTITKMVPEPLPVVQPSFRPEKSASQVVSLFQYLNRPTHQDSMLYIVDAMLNRVEPQDAERYSKWQAVKQLRDGLHQQNLHECGSALLHLIGSGKGLTPSGDDLICGYILILNSVQSAAVKREFVLQVNDLAVTLARSKSTWISANLIEAAAQRLVDDQVGQAALLLLGLCRMDTVTIAAGLESFGNSSGIDTFTGMAAALLP